MDRRPATNRGWRWSRRGRDRGSATAETVLATPLLMLLLLLVVQVGVWAHAAHLAQAAANTGLQAARAYQADPAAGQAAATALLEQTGTTLTGTTVTVDRGPDTVTITVRGTAASVVPFLHPPVSVTLTAPVERLP